MRSATLKCLLPMMSEWCARRINAAAVLVFDSIRRAFVMSFPSRGFAFAICFRFGVANNAIGGVI